MKICLFAVALCIFSGIRTYSQGVNHQWLIGYDTGLFDTSVTSTKARLLFDSVNVSVFGETRKLAFRAAQGNISDQNGNLLMATNGCWIINSTGDTMMNGSGLNPNAYTSQWCNSTSGIPYVYADLFLPMPEDTTKYILFHHTGNLAPVYIPYELYYSIVDMTLDGGLGGVVQKNTIVMQDHLNPGIGACKHANGRDWWVVMLRDSSDLIYKILLTPQGIASVNTQSLGVTNYRYNGQPVFSPDGNKFAYRYFTGSGVNFNNEVRLFDFDRCSGTFSNTYIVQWQDSQPGLGIMFSPNSQYLYASTFNKIYQVNTDTTNIAASLQMVALYDGYLSPYFQTDFWFMYRAANGKIYISSGSGVIDIHYINYPDSGGLACNVVQHGLHLPCYFVRGNINHPNYYLGCDTTSGCTCLMTSLNENEQHDFKFSLSPNPTRGNINIIYILPQNKAGVFEVFDINGKKVFTYNLPPWSTLQNFNLSFLKDGVYQCTITSGNSRVNKKLVVIK